MQTFLAALAGGAIGVHLSWLARLTTVGREVRAHDQALRRLDERLATWVADDTVRLRRELKRLRDELAARGMLESGETGYVIALAKEQALQAYRDQERTANAHAENILGQEGAPHQFARRWRYPQLYPGLKAPGEVAPILDYWAAPVTNNLTPGTPSRTVDDPRRRTTERTLQEIRENPSEWG